MSIQLLACVDRDRLNPDRRTSFAWPPRVMLTDAAWIGPGENACVTLLTLHGVEDLVELSWGRLDPITGLLDHTAHSEGMSFARPCLVVAQQVVQDCDADEFAGRPASVTFASKQRGAFAGMWIPADPHLYQPVAFKLLMAPAGPDLAHYCLRQPLLIEQEQFANWLNPTVSTKELQKAPPAGTFAVLEVDAAGQPASEPAL